MNHQEPLIIIVTRYFEPAGNLPNEWRETWGFDHRYVIAFIRNGVASLHQPNNLASVNPKEHIDDDVWVIHGDLLRITRAKDPLWNSLANLIVAVQTRRGLNILIHPGGETLRAVLGSLSPRLPQSLQALFEKASSYSHEDPQLLQFAQAVTQRQYNPHQQSTNSQSVNRSGYQRALEELRKFAAGKTARTLATRLSILKHRLAHFFSPIDIDLQGLIETGFRQDYWNEVVEAYRDGRAVGNLAQARQLLYGTEGEEDTVEKIVNEAIRQAPTREGEINKAWKQVQSLLPKNGGLPHDYKNVEQILRDLGCQNKREDVKNKCKDRNNPFHQWFVKLNKALDELREALLKEGSTGT